MTESKIHFIGVVTARGGSKGILRKNIVDLAGKPLMYHAIDAALEANCLDRLLVSTEDAEIKTLALKRGVEVIDRPAHLAQDNTPSKLVLRHAVEFLQAEGQNVDWVLLLQPTSPFIKSRRIVEAIRMASETETDSVTTLTELPYVHHPFNIRRLNQDGTAEFLFPDKKARMTNRQTALKAYCYGNLVVTRLRVLMDGETIFGTKTTPVFIKSWEAIDIDDAFSLEIARFLMSRPDLCR